MDVQSSLANRSKGFADPQHGKFATKLQKYTLHKRGFRTPPPFSPLRPHENRKGWGNKCVVTFHSCLGKKTRIGRNCKGSAGDNSPIYGLKDIRYPFLKATIAGFRGFKLNSCLTTAVFQVYY